LAPGILFSETRTPIWPRLSCTSTQSGLVGDGEAQIEREGGLEALGQPSLDEQLLGFLPDRSCTDWAAAIPARWTVAGPPNIGVPRRT